MAAIDQKVSSQAKTDPSLPLDVGKTRLPNIARSLAQPIRRDVSSIVVASLLDRVEHRLGGSIDDVELAMTDLLSVLWSVKLATDAEAWQRVQTQCLAHPVRQLIHQDPFAFRCFTKPRGYAGDAVLIDFLYTRSCQMSESDEVSPLGQRIFDFTRDIPAGHAVRKRRDITASIIDEVCDASHQKPDILSVACGHLREAQLSKAVAAGRTGRFIALDQDEQSLELVARESGHFGITPICSSIKGLFRGPIADNKFDLVYSTGLYDYLDERIATKLTHRMFEMLNPGGRVVVANFVPDLWCRAYMEALLDWNLIYRNEDQMRKLCSTISESEVAKCTTFIEENQNIVFMEIVKR
jgi:extracellular factor (EF) 3-hydroxypalmitic acid methyl ester biosynthesis protein